MGFFFLRSHVCMCSPCSRRHLVGDRRGHAPLSLRAFSLYPARARASSLTLTYAALSLLPQPSRRRSATSAAPVLASFLLLSRVRLRSLSFSRLFFLSPPSYHGGWHCQAPLPSRFFSCTCATKLPTLGYILQPQFWHGSERKTASTVLCTKRELAILQQKPKSRCRSATQWASSYNRVYFKSKHAICMWSIYSAQQQGRVTIRAHKLAIRSNRRIDSARAERRATASFFSYRENLAWDQFTPHNRSVESQYERTSSLTEAIAQLTPLDHSVELTLLV